MNQQTSFEAFRRLPAIDPDELVGLWKGRGIPTGHPFDRVLENLGWFGKRFSSDLRADALLFKSGERRLIAVESVVYPREIGASRPLASPSRAYSFLASSAALAGA